MARAKAQLRNLWPLMILFPLLYVTQLVAQAPNAPNPEDSKALRKEALSDPSPGAFIQQRGTQWTLLSGEEGGRLLGRITWADSTYRNTFEIEASSTLQKGAKEVELLNLDGLAGGDASIQGKWSISGSRHRPKKKGALLTLCESINSALEHQLAVQRLSTCSEQRDHCSTPGCCAGAKHEYDPISGDSCTLDFLKDLGGEWFFDATDAEQSALQAGCDAVAELNGTLAFHAAGRNQYGVRDGEECTEAALSDAIEKTKIDLEQKRSRWKVEEAEWLVKLGRIEAELASATSPVERERLGTARNAASEQIRLKTEAITKATAALKEQILTDPNWLASKAKEKLAPVCKRYNQPDRSDQIPVFGWEQTCHTVEIPKALSRIEDRKLRDAYFKEYIRAIPVSVWFLTFSAGASTREFEYLDPVAISAVQTFAEVADAVQEEAKQDTFLGVKWSKPVGNQFFSLGYEFRNKYKGGTDTEFCAPVAAGGAVTRCVETTAGAPTKIDQNLGLVEWRTYLSGNVGLKLRAFWIDEDFRRKTKIENEWEFHAVLYFLRDKEKGLNGGIDVAYDTAFGEKTARLFIGQSFNIFD